MKSENDSLKNMSLWHQAYKTDPTYTKNYKGVGGFQGTSITGLYIVQRATEIFGPIGKSWGFEIIKDEFISGGPLIHPELGVVGTEQSHSILINMWAFYNGNKLEAQHFGATPHVYINKYGIVTEHDVKKKSLTDAIKKALTMFGFSADVYLGLHDNESYVEHLQVDYTEKKREEYDAELLAKQREYEDWKVKAIRQIFNANQMSELEGLFKSAVRKAKYRNDDDFIKNILFAKDKRKAELENLNIEKEDVA